MNRDYAMWIGLDWGSAQHAICLQKGDGGPLQHNTLEQKPEALHNWLTDLHARFPGEVAVAIEQTRGAVIHFLLGFDFVHILPIHPRSLKNYRDALHPSGAKDDPTDAELLMQFAMLHRNQIRAWAPEPPEIRLLQRMVEYRRRSVQKRVRLTNELTQLLKEYFPQALEWTGDLHTMMACDFLEAWPTLEEIQRINPDILREFYRKHGCRLAHVVANRLAQIRTALPLTTDIAVIQTSVPMTQTLVSQLRPVILSIAQFDKKIGELFPTYPDAMIFNSFPGAGAALAPRLLAVIGSDRSRFNSSAELAQYSGIAPVTERSGKSKWVHRRFACSTFVKQTFHEFAGQSILKCNWARAYYDHKRAHGMLHHAALRALAYRWIRIIYCCWKNYSRYEEEKYLSSLRQRNPTWLQSRSVGHDS